MDELRYRHAEERLWASVGVTPTERRIALQRNNVTVRVQEVGQGPPALFIHGASNSGTSWATLTARVKGLRCILLDRPGCGLSAPLHGVTDIAGLQKHADTLIIDVLDALELDSAHVVATSFGGYTAMRTAAACPNRVDRIVLYGWLTGAPEANMSLFMRLASVRWMARLGTAIPPNERIVRAMLRRIGVRQALESGQFTDEAVDAYLALMRETDTMRNELMFGAGRFLTMRGLDRRLVLSDEFLAQIKTPVFLLWGAEDPFGGPDVARAVTDRLPDAELEIMAGAGHAVWMDDANTVAEKTEAFLLRG